MNFWKLVLTLNNCPLRFPVFLVVWFFRVSRGLVTCWAREGGSHLSRQACHLPSCPPALTAPDQALPVAHQHISMYHCLARRLLSSALSSSCSSTASLSTFLGGKEVLIAATNHRRFASTGLVRDSFQFLFQKFFSKLYFAWITLSLLQSRNHAWTSAQAWGCRPKLFLRCGILCP